MMFFATCSDSKRSAISKPEERNSTIPGCIRQDRNNNSFDLTELITFDSARILKTENFEYKPKGAPRPYKK